MIEFLARAAGARGNRPLRDVLFLGVQHLTGSTVPLFHALADAGVRYDRMFLVGKAYSSHPKVVSCLEGLGCQLSSNLVMLSPSNPYECEIESEIERQLTLVSGLLDSSEDLSALLFDEGGKAIRAIHERFQTQAPRFHCVEQTTRGLREIIPLSLLCPVVNVARSGAKMDLEAPIIAQSMVSAFEEALSEWEPVYHAPARSALVVGYGVIGRNLVRELLSRGYCVQVFDKDEGVFERAPCDGRVSRARDLSEALSEISVVMGCTGGQCLPDNDIRRLRDGALLVNCASSDLEFTAWTLRATATVVHTRSTTGDHRLQPWKNLYSVQNGGRTFYLANGGFPINFSGKLDPIAPEEIQLTRALMYSAGLQAIATREARLFPLSQQAQDLIREWFGRREASGRG